MKLKFVSKLIQIASLQFIEALEGSKITEGNQSFCWNSSVDRIQQPTASAFVLKQG